MKKGNGHFFLSSFFISHAEVPKALPNQIRLVIVKSGFVNVGFVLILVYYVAASKVIEDFPTVTPLVLQRTFVSGQIGWIQKRWNRFVHVSSTNGTKSSTSVSEVHLLFRLAFLSYEEELKYGSGHHMECTPLLDSNEQRWSYLRLRSPTGNEVGLAQKRLNGSVGRTHVREQFGIKPVPAGKGVVHVFRSYL